MRRCVGALLGALGVVAMAVPGHAAAAELLGHRALYRMTLGSADSSSGIVGARGAMLYSFADSCDGWTVENRTHMQIQYEEGEEVASTWSFVGWEAKDGLSYSFRLRHVRDGRTIEKLQGRATLDHRGGPGLARLTIPPDTTIELPPGTMFPTDHLQALIAAARNGDNFLSRAVFDGTTLDNPFKISAFIGKPVTATGGVLAETPGLAPRPAWWMRLAFFPLASRAAAPEYEIELDYRDDGIADRIVQDFGDFTLGLDADAIEILSAPDC